MKLYAVSQGEYSDYGIVAIFDSKELAQKFINSFDFSTSLDEMRIEKYDLNPFEKQIREGFKAYWVRMDKKGNTSLIEQYHSISFMSDNNGISYTHDKKEMNYHGFAKDEKHAIKIANEKRVQIIASNKWGIE